MYQLLLFLVLLMAQLLPENPLLVCVYVMLLSLWFIPAEF